MHPLHQPAFGHLLKHREGSKWTRHLGLWAWEPTNNATNDDKDELVDLFTQKYGEGSVVSVMMHSVYGNQQQLFAR
ncbi:hypothetical protein LINPERHAP1_LOCUS4670, partial [Linum perenne]